MSLRTWPALALSLCLAAPALAQNAQLRAVTDEDWCNDEYGEHNNFRTCTVYEGSWAAAGPISVDARPNGGIHVQGWDRNEVRLRAKVVTMADDEAEARQIASQVRIQTGGAIRAEGPTRNEGRSHRGWWVSYRLDVPRNAALSLESTNGGIHLARLDGDVSFTTTNGGLHLENMNGNVRGRTTNGGVHLQLAGNEWRGEGLDLVTTNGGVHVQVPRSYNARLEVATTNGRVHGDVAGSRSDDEDDEDEGEDDSRVRRGRHDRRKKSLNVQLGSGGRLLRIRTTNGGVHVNQG
jgi:hypothetical protein